MDPTTAQHAGFPSLESNPASDTSKVPGITEGRIVHYVMPPTPRNPKGSHRAAIITNAHGGQATDGMVNLTVFLDPLNDYPSSGNYTSKEGYNVGYCIPAADTMPIGSVKYSEGKEFGTWHWIERA